VEKVFVSKTRKTPVEGVRSSGRRAVPVSGGSVSNSLLLPEDVRVNGYCRVNGVWRVFLSNGEELRPGDGMLDEIRENYVVVRGQRVAMARLKSTPPVVASSVKSTGGELPSLGGISEKLAF